MNWMVEGTFHALVTDKARQKLTVWRIDDGEPVMIESYRCSTGEKMGDKWIRGDMRTPEGVYFFRSVIDGLKLPEKYGLWAFTTDYPNFVDRRRGKSGDGIWLHGRDRPLGPGPDSNGCIALENKDLIKVSRYVRLQSTPLIVVNRLRMVPKEQIMEQERDVRDFIESWRRAWESKDLERYMSHYSPNFQSCWLDYNRWKEKKRRLNRRYSKIRVKLGKVYLYRQNGLITAIFTQSYKSDGFRATGIKVLYITDKPRYLIYAEDFHQRVDDPFPVRTLLARVGVTDIPEVDERVDFRIRLVSADEPDGPGRGGIESPRPVGPARGVVLDIARPVQWDRVRPEPLDRCRRSTVAASGKRRIVPVLSSNEVCAASLVAGLSDRPKPAELVPPEKPAAPPVRVVAERRPREAPRPREQSKQKSSDRWGVVATARGFQEFDDDYDAAPTGGTPSAQRPDDTKSASLDSAVLGFLRQWKTAWEQKDLDSFIKMYHPDFQTGKLNRSKLRRKKRSFFRKYHTIRVELDRVKIQEVNGRLHVRFRQTFRGDDYRDKGWKDMVLAGSKDKGFRILSEVWSPR